MTSPNVPSIELCREMERLGICQEKPSLWFVYEREHFSGGLRIDAREPFLSDEKPPYSFPYQVKFIAPTVVEMMEALPEGFSVHKKVVCFVVRDMRFISPIDYEPDKSLPNALAKALVQIRKDASNETK